MSKTRGNVLDPLDFLESYGADALRFAVSTGISPGNDTKLSFTKLEAGRNFANKIWNAARFVVRSSQSYKGSMDIKHVPTQLEDRWIISRLNGSIADVNRLMGEYQFGEAQRQIHDFLWGEFCDWYIEMTKNRIGKDLEVSSPVPVLVHVLETSMRLLHPFMPFITEELWQDVKKCLPDEHQSADSIMVASYPRADKITRDEEAERVMAAVIEIVRSIRNVRAQHDVEAGRLIDAIIYTELKPSITAFSHVIERLAKASVKIFYETEEHKAENALVLVLNESEVVIPMASMVDFQAERQRLAKEVEQMRAEVKRLEKMLKNEAFLIKAPPAVVCKEKNRLSARQDSLKRLKEHLASLTLE
jgi:valyl-tRNA synthetase